MKVVFSLRELPHGLAVYERKLKEKADRKTSRNDEMTKKKKKKEQGNRT